MIIAIDANEANVTRRVGINQFAFGVLWYLYRQRFNFVPVGEKQAVDLEFRIFLAQKPKDDLPSEEKNWHYEVFGPKRFWTWFALSKRLYWGRPRPDVLLSLSHYGPGFSPIPFVPCLMDLGFLRFRQQFTAKDFYQLKLWTLWSIKRAAKIIAISHFTKQDLVRTYQVEPEKIVVAHPGYKKIGKTRQPSRQTKLRIIKKKYGIKGNYLLCLSTLKPSKNIEGLLEAYRILLDKCSANRIDLVIAGKKGWLYESIFKKVQKLRLEKRVIFTDFVPDEEVPLLMRGAKVFVMPSFWEGFGIPVLEAMEAETPVVCSRVGSLPEIAGKAAYLVNPYRPEEIARALCQVLTDKNLAKDLVQRGKEQIKMFSWEKCSKIILQTLWQLK